MPSRIVSITSLALLALAATSMARGADIAVGDAAPNFEAERPGGESFELAASKGKQPVVLVFSRGHWCPFCNAHMRSLQKSYPKMKELGAELVVVYREDDAAGVKKAIANAKAEFPMVVDQNKKQTGSYSPVGYDVYVVDKEGVVRAVLEGTKAARPSAKDILAELEKLGDE